MEGKVQTDAEEEEDKEQKQRHSEELSQLSQKSEGNKPAQTIGDEKKRGANTRSEGPKEDESGGKRGRSRSRNCRNKRSDASPENLHTVRITSQKASKRYAKGLTVKKLGQTAAKNCHA